MKFNNTTVIVVIVVLLAAWIIKRRKTSEKYGAQKAEIIANIKSADKLDSLLAMTAAAKLTKDEAIIQSAYTLASEQKKPELVKLFEKL